MIFEVREVRHKISKWALLIQLLLKILYLCRLKYSRIVLVIICHNDPVSKYLVFWVLTDCMYMALDLRSPNTFLHNKLLYFAHLIIPLFTLTTRINSIQMPKYFRATKREKESRKKLNTIAMNNRHISNLCQILHSLKWHILTRCFRQLFFWLVAYYVVADRDQLECLGQYFERAPTYYFLTGTKGRVRAMDQRP